MAPWSGSSPDPQGRRALVLACCREMAVFILSHPWEGQGWGEQLVWCPGRVPAGYFSYISAKGDLPDTNGCPHPQVISLVVQAWGNEGGLICLVATIGKTAVLSAVERLRWGPGLRRSTMAASRLLEGVWLGMTPPAWTLLSWSLPQVGPC